MGYSRLLLVSLMAFSVQASLGHDSTAAAVIRVTADISNHPEEPLLYLNRASLHLEGGDWQACLADLDQADRHAKSDLGLRRMRGRALVLGKQWSDAKAVFGTHLKSHPSDFVAWTELAHVHEALGEMAEAAKACAQSIRLRPHPEPDHFIECADLLVRAGRDDEALALLDRAPLLLATVDRAIVIELDHGHHEAALRRMDALLAVTKIQEPLLAKRASILAQAGRRAESIEAWKSLIESIAHMPTRARNSQAMTLLATQSRMALESLNQTSDLP